MIKKIILILIFSLIGVFILGALSYKGKFSNFDEAFLFIEGNQDIFISVDEYKKTLRLLEKWEWGDKFTPEDEKFRIISIEGYECVKIWSSQPTALLNSTHPLKEFSDENSLVYSSQNFSTYNCMENLNLYNFDGEFYLYGQPFFYDERWWLYKPFEPSKKLISFVCSSDCGTHWQAFAKPEPILKSDPIYQEK
tara:strand:+ start:946 stop:1527 length:582 start_codon:yes stop_codon:yes gene_type:complete